MPTSIGSSSRYMTMAKTMSMPRLKRLRMIGAMLLRATRATPDDASVFKPI